MRESVPKPLGWLIMRLDWLVRAACVPLLSTPPLLAQTTWYVDDTAPNGDGLGWTTAHRFLQDALSVAGPGDEFRVAQGAYRPDETQTEPDGSGVRSAAFVVGDGLGVLGVYVGLAGGGDPNDCDPALHETILFGAGDEMDVFLIEASGDAGETWSPASQVGPTGTIKAWRRTTFLLENAVDLGADVRIRFIASDLGEDTIIEAAVDDVRIEAVLCGSCAADFNGDGSLDLLDFVAFQNAFVSGDPAADCEGTGSLNTFDFVCFLSRFQAGCP